MLITQPLETGHAAHEQVEHQRSALHLAGSVALKNIENENTVIHAPLPEGYYYDPANDIADKEELANLMRDAGLLNSPTKSELETDATWDLKLGVQTLGVGVRTPNGLLVGYGALLHKDDVGEMGNLVVSPGYRGQGIGTAIIDTRVKSADALGLKSLFIEGLQKTNVAYKHYESIGFQELPGGSLGRGENPRMIEL